MTSNNKYLAYLYRAGDFIEKVYYSIKSVIVSSIFKRAFLTVSIICAILFSLPLLFDNSLLKFKITEKLTELTGADISIEGDIQFRFLPTPGVIIKDIFITNYKLNQGSKTRHDFYSNKALIKIPLTGVSKNFMARNVILYQPKLESYPDIELFHKNTDISELKAKHEEKPAKKKKPRLLTRISLKLFNPTSIDSSSLKLSHIGNLKIINGEFINYDQLFRAKKRDKINLILEGRGKSFIASGNFFVNDQFNTIDLALKIGGSSYFEIISSAGQVKFNGKINGNSFSGAKYNGKMDINILQLKNFYGSYFSRNDFIFNKLSPSAGSIKISGELNGSNNEIAIQNINLSSNILSGKGSIDLGINNKIPTIDATLSLSHLNIDEIWSADPINISAFDLNEKQVLVKSKDSDDNGEENLNLKTKEIDLTLELTIEKAEYLGGEIKDINFYSAISGDNKAIILPLTFTAPGNSKIRITGVIDSSQKVPKFIGKIDGNGDDLEAVFKWFQIKAQNLKYDTLKKYAIYCDILLLPNNIILDNIYLNLANNTNEFLGRVSVSKDSNRNNIIDARFQGNELNIDDYFLTSGRNSYLSHGSFLEKIFWLNDIFSKNKISLAFDKLLYQNEVFFDQSVNFELARGYLKIEDLELKSANTDVKVGLILDITGSTPYIDLRAEADKFHFLSYEDKTDKDNKVKTITFYDNLYSLPSLKGFEGSIKLSLKEVKIDDLQIEEFNLSGEMNNGALKPARIQSKIYGGILEYNGLIEIGLNKIFNGSIIYKNASLQPILSNLIAVDNISGLANIAATITSSASSPEKFLNNTYGEIKFNSNSLTVSSYGLSELVSKMFTKSLNKEEIQSPELILFNENAKTLYNKADGEIKIFDSESGNIIVKLSAPAINSILSGSINAGQPSISGHFNSIFLTGDLVKQIPISIATNISINKSGISQKTNLNQVNQYLNIAR